jgi:hypothetical protein
VDEEGWDRIVPFFIVFDWESALDVRDERQEKWDKSTSENSRTSSSHFVKHID